MTFDNTQPTASDGLSLVELELYHLIMDYRASLGLSDIPLSTALTTTAGRHAADTLYNIWDAGLQLPEGANLHSWSDAPYFSDHSLASNMWTAPQRIGTNYPGNGFEISAAGYADIAAALAGWQGSPGHDAVITSSGVWSDRAWNAIGIGVEIDSSVSNYGGRIYHVWFGFEPDPSKPAMIFGTQGGESIAGTEFADRMKGKGGDDTMDGAAGNDRINGGRGHDDIRGGAENDKIKGGGGKDALSGEDGRDVLDGGRGKDMMTGGAGKDLFVFSHDTFGRDTITDYSGDRVRISAAGEVQSQQELVAALTEKNGDTIYDHLNDGANVIVFQGVQISDLDLTLFDFG